MPYETANLEAQPWRRSNLLAYWTLAVLVILYVLNSLDRMILNLVVGGVKLHLGINDFQISLLMGLTFGLFFALFGLPIGWLADRMSRRWLLFAGVTFWSLATIACGLSNSFAELAVARVALAIGEATLGPVAHSLLADTIPKKRLGVALSIYTLGGVLGTGLSLALGGAALAYFEQQGGLLLPGLGEFAPWQAVFVCLGFPGLILAFLALTLRTPIVRGQNHSSEPGFFAFLHANSALFLCFLGSFGVFIMASVGVVSWMPSHALRTFGWSAAEAGLWLGAVHTISVAAGTLSFGMISDRVFSKGYRDAPLRVFIGSIAIAAPVGVAAFLMSDSTMFLIGLGLFLLFGNTYIGIASAALQLVTPSRFRGRIASLFLLVLYLIGFGGGASLVALVTEYVFGSPDKLGWALALTIGVLAPLSLISAGLGLKRMREAVAARANDA